MDYCLVFLISGVGWVGPEQLLFDVWDAGVNVEEFEVVGCFYLYDKIEGTWVPQ